MGSGWHFFETVEAAGFPSVHPVTEQTEPDAAFPTVAFPNPEEDGALDLSIATAKKQDAALIIAHDPDADRLALALPRDGEYIPLTGTRSALFSVGIAPTGHTKMESPGCWRTLW